MRIDEIATLLEGKILVQSDAEVVFGVASDLMSDVLTLDGDDIALLTGLVNVQTIRTAEMADIPLVVFVRGKTISSEIIEMAKESGIGVIRSEYGLFRGAGCLYGAGLKPMY